MVGEPGAAGGRLVVVGTPIGNLGDLSPRAADALRGADLVVAEDTRMAARLLGHLAVRRPTLSFNEHNADARLPDLLARLAAGATLALTTDAGMPAISDPGARLVAAARAAGAVVEVVPGPTAVTAAMALAGVEASGFVFGGFLPSRPVTARQDALERLLDAAGTPGLPLILYEAPNRVRDLLRRLEARVEVVVLCRELTKLHEQVLAGSPPEVAAMLTEVRGEFTVVVDHVRVAETGAAGLDAAALASEAARQGLSRRTISDLLRAGGLARRQAYALAEAAVGEAAASADDRL